ncbi:chromosomal replication initiator protein DnaA [Neorhodopirellula pilleata]|uniref:Uncharacterized protein n=1 Tax=Neorhodopirellula pilleata TaxID=2714738 RepID=A0A5C6AQF7_9BACT|nr:hypothetical protein [Neorhodopirellula pilleata]TWU01681.1 hypothetical protein Pla100_14160 [Neorhodopirellula pilleata]
MPARSKRRNLLALLATAVAATSLGTADASACCLTDWLYGRQPAYAVAPVPVIDGTVPYSAGYTPYAASVAGVYTAGYTPLLTTGTASTYSVQRPAYGAVPLNNPSVYTGLPVATGYRGLSTPGNSFYGTGNMYPNTYGSAAPAVTSLRPDLAASPMATAVPAPAFATPIRSGLARFFDSLLGTGYRTSYYTAPITYYRPATTIDPITGTTVTVQQPCSSTVQQIQRTPYATLEPYSAGNAYPANTLQPCGGTGCANDPSMGYGATTIPSTISPSTIPSTVNPYGGVSGYDANGATGIGGDYQPMSPPTLPQANFSGRPDLSTTYPQYDSNSQYDSSSQFGSSFSNPSSNLSPLTGSSSFPSSGDDYRFPAQDSTPSASDRQPLRAPELQDARSANPADEVNDAYRQGYEAAKAELEERRRDQLQDNYDSYRYESESSERPPVRSEYQLDPPANGRPSTEPTSGDGSWQRSRYEIERDQQDLRDLTTQNGNGNRSWPRVRPIPAPENYRNPFAGATSPVAREVAPATSQPTTAPATENLKAPDLLPALPRPATQFNSNYERPTRFQNENRLSVPVREASLQGVPNERREPMPKANQWRTEAHQPTRETGWYAKSPSEK